jgi:hypothetical protein
MNEILSRKLNRWQRWLLIAGAVLLAAAIADGFRSPTQFFRSYLLGYMFWIGLSLGCAAFLLLHYLTGGNWGIPIKRPLEAGVRTIPLMSALVIPLLFGMRNLFPWMHPQIVAANPELQWKSVYLNWPFFLGREAIYFAFWLYIAYRLSQWSAATDRTGETAFVSKLEGMSGWALVAYGLTVTFFSIDWVMSLESYWFSTIWGLIFIAIQVQAGIAFSVVVAQFLGNYDPVDRTITPQRFNDLGNLLLTFTMIWAYLAFSQFLIIWTGNLLNEIPWYMSRMGQEWEIIAGILLIAYFAAPFFLLLLRDVKRRAIILARLCVVVLILNFVDLFWMIVPAFHPHHVHIYLMDFLLTLGMGSIWVAFFIWKLKSYPLLPYRDPRYAGVLGNAE